MEDYVSKLREFSKLDFLANQEKPFNEFKEEVLFVIKEKL